MKKILYTLCLSTLFIACGADADAKTDSNGKERTEAQTDTKRKPITKEAEREVNSHNTPITDEKNMAYVKRLINANFLPALKANSRKEMFKGDGPDFVEYRFAFFTPNEFSGEFLYAQILYHRGDVIEDDFVVFYPNLDGKLDDKTYFQVQSEDRPCTLCSLDGINSSKDSDPIGIFISRTDLSNIEKQMGYNLQEMSIYWMDK